MCRTQWPTRANVYVRRCDTLPPLQMMQNESAVIRPESTRRQLAACETSFSFCTGSESIECLPDEVLRQVFSKLSLKQALDCWAVCKRWKRLYADLGIDSCEVEFVNNASGTTLRLVVVR